MSGHFYLNITLSDAARTFPGTSRATLKEGLLTSVKPGDANAAGIPGVGDAAIYVSNAPIRAKTTAFVKGIMLGVDFEGADARARKEQVIALLKLAAARL